ncbi:hypothetical protein ACSXDC_16095 (plasmid) [Clostridium perfringens]
MIGFKRDIKTIMKNTAKARGISLKEFRAEIQEDIYVMLESDNPEVQATYKKLFGNKVPTPEEYVYNMTKSIAKKVKF